MNRDETHCNSRIWNCSKCLFTSSSEKVALGVRCNYCKFYISYIYLVQYFLNCPRFSLLSHQFQKDDLPGAVPPTGFFDPFGFYEKADRPTALRYREAEVTHGRVAMLAVVGFLVGEKVEGSSFLFDAQIAGPAITHFFQVPAPFWQLLAIAIGAAEVKRAQIAFISPADLGPQEAGRMRDDHYPGDIGFDPFGLKPTDPDKFDEMTTKELQHGRLAMLAASGFLAQEAVDGKGILEHLGY